MLRDIGPSAALVRLGKTPAPSGTKVPDLWFFLLMTAGELANIRTASPWQDGLTPQVLLSCMHIS